MTGGNRWRPAPPLTTRGWGLLAASAVALFTGWLFGIAELQALAATAAAVTALAVLWVASRPVELEVNRRLVPARVQAGQDVSVALAVTNRGRRPTTTVGLVDRNPAASDARLRLGPLGPGQAGSGAYRCPTARRGVFPIGPLSVVVTDPLGLATRTVVTAGTSGLIVHPVPEPSSPVLVAAGSGRAQPASAPVAGRDNDEFGRLRSYEAGDDVRRVHWPSSARTGSLVVREDELDHAGHVTLVVDLRRSRWSPPLLERALSLTAGMAETAIAADLPVRLVVTTEGDTGVGSGERHLGRILDELAAVGTRPPARRGRPRGATRPASHLDEGGTTVIVTADPAATADLKAGIGTGRSARVVTVVVDRADGRREAP